MDIPVELNDEAAANDEAPEETKESFWGGLGDFIGNLLGGIPG